MSNRSIIQRDHENAVLEAALAEHNRILGMNLVVIDRPDPPDAILSDGTRTTWLELTDAFFSAEWARDIFSYAAHEPHRPMSRGPYMNMDAQFAERFCDLVIQKSSKASYKPFVSQYGPGILVVGLESPWLESDTIDAINEEWDVRGNACVSSTFEFIYLGYRNEKGNMAIRWR